MRELPILFSTPMVKAFLKNRKTMTRRVIKPQPPDGSMQLYCDDEYFPTIINRNGLAQPGPQTFGAYDEYGEWGVKCPYQPGDLLYVRETWRLTDFEHVDGDWNASVQFRADNALGVRLHYLKNGADERIGWRPSIFMPKAAARIWLEVTNVRVERLQKITEEDARAEGVGDPYEYQCPIYYDQPHMRGLKINQSAFAGLWDSLNAKRGFEWETNPFCWAITLEVIEKGH